MEYPLTIIVMKIYKDESCLNPCSNGIPSDTMIQRALIFLLF